MEIILIILFVLYSSVLVLASAEYLAVYFPYWMQWMDRKPFNCRPCLSFHLSMVNTTLLAALLLSIKLFVCGFGVAVLLFGLAKYLDHKRINL